MRSTVFDQEINNTIYSKGDNSNQTTQNCLSFIQSIKDTKFDEKLIEKIKNSSSVLLVGHTNPDFDCLGAMLGMQEILENLGKNVSLVINKGVSEKYLAIPGVKRIASFVRPIDKKYKLYDAVIILDCKNIEQVSKSVMDDTEGIIRININNHKSCEALGNLNFNDSSFSSTSEIVCSLSKALNVNLFILNRAVLYALYSGIINETFNLTKNASDATKNLSLLLKKIIGKKRLQAYQNEFLIA